MAHAQHARFDEHVAIVVGEAVERGFDPLEILTRHGSAARRRDGAIRLGQGVVGAVLEDRFAPHVAFGLVPVSIAVDHLVERGLVEPALERRFAAILEAVEIAEHFPTHGLHEVRTRLPRPHGWPRLQPHERSQPREVLLQQGFDGGRVTGAGAGDQVTGIDGLAHVRMIRAPTRSRVASPPSAVSHRRMSATPPAPLRSAPAHIHRTVAATVLSGLLVAQDPADFQAKVEADGGFSPNRDALVDENGESWLRLRVVDAMTGEPLRSAEVLLIAESAAPITGEFHYAMRADADSYGFVEVRVDAGAEDYAPWSWAVVRAEGYSPIMRMRTFDSSIVRLVPAMPLRLQIRDWRDRPVPGVLVGHCKGCGHTPDLASGTTGPDGTVTLPSIDTWRGIHDNYVVHPDLQLGYDGNRWRVGSDPLVLLVGAGVVHRGRVVDHKGKPVGGAAVGMSTVHRGPWTKTLGDGSFELCGLDGPTDLYVQHEGRRYLFEERGTTGLRLELPKLPKKAPDHPDHVFHVELSETEREAQKVQRDQRLRLHEQREAQWPRVHVRVAGQWPENGSVELQMRRRSIDLDSAIARGETVGLPDEECYFVLRGPYGAEQFVPLDREQAIRDGAVRLQWFAPTMVEGQVLDAGGEPARFEAAIAYSCDEEVSEDQFRTFEGGLALPTFFSGPFWLVVRDRRSRAQRILPVDLPERSEDAFVDVGTVELVHEPPHRFVDAEGQPLAGGTVRVLRAGWCDVDDGWKFDLDDRGTAWLPDLREGDALLVRPAPIPLAGEGEELVIDLPSRFVIGAEVPAVFRRHAGQLRLDVDGGDAVVHAMFGDRVVPVRPDRPSTLVRGLPPGSTSIYLGAIGRQSGYALAELPEDGTPAVVSGSLEPRRE